MDDDQASELEALERILGDANEDPIRLSYALMRSITEKFSNEIGRGGFGVVYQGSVRNGMVAVKMISNAHNFSDKEFMDEINCLIRAKHKNIVRFLGYCSDTQREVMEFDGKLVLAEINKRLLCFEYVPNGNIQQYIEEKHHGDERHMGYKIIKGICEGLHYLHQERITHLDLKPENVMLDAQMEPKITDFGLSRFLDEGQSKIITKNIRGTPGYIAPEVINTGKISLKSDIYALGIIFAKLLTGQNYIDFDNWHKSLSCMECPLVKSCIEIARTCMEHDQDKRPTVGEILDKLNEMESTMQGSSKSWHDVADTSAGGWPTECGMEVAMSAVPERTWSSLSSDCGAVPSYFLCPILQEVMRDPQVAGDGFTYEAEAIRAWLGCGHDTSPMTNLKLPTDELLPNRTLRAAIQEWRYSFDRKASS